MAVQVIGALIRGLGTAARTFGGKVARRMPLGSRLKRAVGRGGREAWKFVGGATGRDIKNASSPWEATTLRQQNVAILESLASQFGEYANGFAHSISVAVKGGPGADLRRIYYLACAAAFGRFREGVTEVLNHKFRAHWDVTAKMVQVTVAYTCGGTTATIRQFTQGLSTTPLDVIQRGPSQLTLGASWPRFLKTVSGIATQSPVEDYIVRGGAVLKLNGAAADEVIGAAVQKNAPAQGRDAWTVDQGVLRLAPLVPVTVLQPWVLVGNANPLRELPVDDVYKMQVIAPQGKPYVQKFVQGTALGTVRLPDEGRLITTGEVNSPLVQPPRPPVDGISRGSMVEVTTAALLNPGFLPELPDLTATPVASTGYYPTSEDKGMVPVNGVWSAVKAAITTATAALKLDIPAVPKLKE